MLRHVFLCAALFVTILSWNGWSQIIYPPARGQMPAPTASQKRYKISGTVVNSATGEPIGRAMVQVSGQASQQLFTDANGRFEMADVPEGPIGISARRPGFLGSEMTTHRPQMITVGPATPSIQVRLIPEGTVKGKVTSNEGEPIENVRIQIYGQQINNGRKTWFPHGGANTDENGEYEIGNLPPGQYLLYNFAHPLFPVGMAVENGPSTDIYAPQYFPNAPSQDSAQPVTVQAGQTAAADIRLSPVPSYSVSGTVSGPPNTQVTCDDAEGNPMGQGGVNRRTGQFQIRYLPAGSCTLSFRATGENGAVSGADQPVTINSSNVTNIQVALQLLPDVPVHFSNATTPIPLQLQLIPRHRHRREIWFQPMLQGGQQGGQTPVFKSVPPGSYQVVPQGFNNVCVGSITSGGTDLLREDLTVTGGGSPAPIEVALRNDCATITVTVNTGTANATSSPNTNISLLVLPDSGNAAPRLLSAWNGNVSISGLTPGDYTVYAFSDVSDLEYANPEALREFSGQKVTVSSGEKATLQLNVITRGDSK